MSKGGDFERSFSRKLSLWFSWGVSDDWFWHTAGSGGMATNRLKNGKKSETQHGDICATCEEGKPLERCWSIELKTGYADKSKVKDADGDVIKIPIFEPTKKGEKKKPDSERKIIGWKDKKSLILWDLLDIVDSRQKEAVIITFWKQALRDAELSHRVPVMVFRRNRREACICFSRGYFGKLVDFFGYPSAIVIQISMKMCILSLKDFFEWIPDIRGIIESTETNYVREEKSTPSSQVLSPGGKRIAR
jgi:hypothetical protein